MLKHISPYSCQLPWNSFTFPVCLFAQMPDSVFLVWSVSTNISLNHSWILQQWHHCISPHAFRSLHVCLCVSCLCMLVRCSIKTSHCVPTARLLLSCFRGDGKNQGCCVYRQGQGYTENTYVIQRNWQPVDVALIATMKGSSADAERKTERLKGNMIGVGFFPVCDTYFTLKTNCMNWLF